MAEQGMCPTCKVAMKKKFAAISGNAKYVTFSCGTCNFEKMECVGTLR